MCGLLSARFQDLGAVLRRQRSRCCPPEVTIQVLTTGGHDPGAILRRPRYRDGRLSAGGPDPGVIDCLQKATIQVRFIVRRRPRSRCCLLSAKGHDPSVVDCPPEATIIEWSLGHSTLYLYFNKRLPFGLMVC